MISLDDLAELPPNSPVRILDVTGRTWQPCGHPPDEPARWACPAWQSLVDFYGEPHGGLTTRAAQKLLTSIIGEFGPITILVPDNPAADILAAFADVETGGWWSHEPPSRFLQIDGDITLTDDQERWLSEQPWDSR